MNLLRDDWIPVKKSAEYKRVSLSDVLCTKDCGTVFLPRDDLQFATVQMCICLVQSIFTPKDEKELRSRHKTLMSREEYSEISKPFVDLFFVDEEKGGFMQDSRTKAEKETGIQKLFVGLPEGDNSHTMFVPPDEITKICPSCAAIALYNWASGASSFGGGFKNPLRGIAPISVLIYDNNLRNMIWNNVIPKNSDWYKLYIKGENLPVWKKTLESGALIDVSGIGIMRGLFWQPASVLLRWRKENGVCDCCGLSYNNFCYKFDKQKFKYELSEKWKHPHSSLKKGENSYYVPSFRAEAPAWEHLSEIFPEGRVGECPPVVIENYSNVILREDLHIQGFKQKTTLSVGGYVIDKNKSALIIERHHHLIMLSNSLLSIGTEGEGLLLKDLRLLLDTAIEIKKSLKNSITNFFKVILNSSNRKGEKDVDYYGFVKKAEKMFFQQSELLILESLSSYNDNTLLVMISELKRICERILQEITYPWLANSRGAKAFIKAEDDLKKRINTIKSKFKNGGKDESVK